MERRDGLGRAVRIKQAALRSKKEITPSWGGEKKSPEAAKKIAFGGRRK